MEYIIDFLSTSIGVDKPKLAPPDEIQFMSFLFIEPLNWTADKDKILDNYFFP